MKVIYLFASAVFALSAGALAQTAVAPPRQLQPTSNAVTAGEVRKVDKEAAKITIRHGPLLNLDMPAMTMVFRVADPHMLDTFKPGDRVRFVAEKVGDQLTVTRIELAK